MGAEIKVTIPTSPVKTKMSSEAFESITVAYSIHDLVERYGEAIRIIENLVGASQLAELQDMEKALAAMQKPNNDFKNILSDVRFLISKY